MIFWQYHPKLKNGEYWVTQEKYILLQEKHHKSNISYRKNTLKDTELIQELTMLQMLKK